MWVPSRSEDAGRSGVTEYIRGCGVDQRMRGPTMTQCIPSPFHGFDFMDFFHLNNGIKRGMK